MKIQTFEIGAFGNRIADLLQNHFELVRHNVQGQYPSKQSFQTADVNLVISEHPCVTFCKQVENFSYNKGAMFLPMIIDHPHLTIGPVTNADDAACYHCYIDRFMQHNPIATVSETLFKYYDEHPAQGPKGYHPSIASFVANWITHLLSDNPAALAGKIIRIHTGTVDCVTSTVIGVDGCERCGLQRDYRTRSYEQLKEFIRTFTSEGGNSRDRNEKN